MNIFQALIPILASVLVAACAPATVAPPAADPRPVVPLYAIDLTAPDAGPDALLSSALAASRAGNNDIVLSAARRIAERYPNTPWYKRSLFLTALALIQLDRASEADAAMLRVQAEYPELADYAVFNCAEYHAIKGRYSRAAALYQHLIERYPTSSLSVRASFRRAQALSDAYAYLQSAEAFERFLQDNPRSDLAPAAGIGLGRALTMEADLSKAVRAYQDVIVRYPGNPADQEVEKALAELRAGGVDIPELTPAELYERGKNLARAGQHEKAIEAFAKMLAREPDSANRMEALFRTGIAAYHLGRRGEAAIVLERMVKDYPGDARTPEALNWLGKSYSKLGDWDRGVKAFQRILDRFPDSEWADDALFLIGNIYRETGDMKKALHYYARLTEEYPESKFADSAIWWRAWSWYGAGDQKKAEQTLQEIVSRYPRSFLVNQAYYWLGRSAEKRGDQKRAAQFYERVLKRGPYTYYGYRAAERRSALESMNASVQADIEADLALCGATPCPDDLLSLSETEEGPPVWTDETRELLAKEPSFRRTLELMQLDRKKEAAAELWYLQDKMPRRRGALIGLSKAFFELGDYNRSLLLVLRNYERYLEAPQSSAHEDLWRLAYPQGYWESITTYARKYGQDPYFVAAIIREESQFHANALSPAGARGLMQVMPATGEWAAKQIRLPNFDAEKLFDFDTVINIGTWYIGHLMKRFKGDRLLVAAAYNAGPEAVVGWSSKNGYGKDRDVFVESIPYAETRGYVKKVMRNYAEYKRIYNKNAGTADIGLQRQE